MKIGISSWTLPYSIGITSYETPSIPLSYETLMQKAIENGAEVLQYADNLPVINASSSILERLFYMAQTFKIEIELGTKGLRLDNLLRYLDIAKMLKSKLIRTLPHDHTCIPSIAEAKEKLSYIIPALEKSNVILAIENHDFYSSSQLKELIDYFPDTPIGICLDAVNNLGIGESFNEVMNNLGSISVNFHCKDYCIKRKPSMMGFDVIGAIAGEGLLNLNYAYQRLNNNISWIIESWLPWQGNLSETLILEEHWMQSGLKNLKKFRSDTLYSKIDTENYEETDRLNYKT